MGVFTGVQSSIQVPEHLNDVLALGKCNGVCGVNVDLQVDLVQLVHSALQEAAA